MNSKPYEGCLICTDMDGTLLADDKSLSAENAEAIRCFQQGGGLFTVATGRYWDFIEEYKADVVPNTAVISLNGCAITEYETHKYLWHSKMDKCCFGEAEEIFASCPQLTMLLVNMTGGFVPIKRGELWRLEEIKVNAENEILKMTYMCLPDETLDERTCRFFAEFSSGRYNCERSWPGGMEYYPLEGGKHNAVEWLKKHTNSSKLICVGDFENDIGMLKFADVGVAVSNGLESVRSAADYTTVSNGESAIARIIERI